MASSVQDDIKRIVELSKSDKERALRLLDSMVKNQNMSRRDVVHARNAMRELVPEEKTLLAPEMAMKTGDEDAMAEVLRASSVLTKKMLKGNLTSDEKSKLQELNRGLIAIKEKARDKSMRADAAKIESALAEHTNKWKDVAGETVEAGTALLDYTLGLNPLRAGMYGLFRDDVDAWDAFKEQLASPFKVTDYALGSEALPADWSPESRKAVGIAMDILNPLNLPSLYLKGINAAVVALAKKNPAKAIGVARAASMLERASGSGELRKAVDSGRFAEISEAVYKDPRIAESPALFGRLTGRGATGDEIRQNIFGTDKLGKVKDVEGGGGLLGEQTAKIKDITTRAEEIYFANPNLTEKELLEQLAVEGYNTQSAISSAKSMARKDLNVPLASKPRLEGVTEKSGARILAKKEFKEPVSQYGIVDEIMDAQIESLKKKKDSLASGFKDSVGRRNQFVSAELEKRIADIGKQRDGYAQLYKQASDAGYFDEAQKYAEKIAKADAIASDLGAKLKDLKSAKVNPKEYLQTQIDEIDNSIKELGSKRAKMKSDIRSEAETKYFAENMAATPTSLEESSKALNREVSTLYDMGKVAATETAQESALAADYLRKAVKKQMHDTLEFMGGDVAGYKLAKEKSHDLLDISELISGEVGKKTGFRGHEFATQSGMLSKAADVVGSRYDKTMFDLAKRSGDMGAKDMIKGYATDLTTVLPAVGRAQSETQGDTQRTLDKFNARAPQSYQEKAMNYMGQMIQDVKFPRNTEWIKQNTDVVGMKLATILGPEQANMVISQFKQQSPIKQKEMLQKLILTAPQNFADDPYERVDGTVPLDRRPLAKRDIDNNTGLSVKERAMKVHMLNTTGRLED